jgi:4-diphosphocytidyl-2-C-methyl-D-erythritol kinase
MTRRARVPALAKINLDLRVLSKRPDGYHELRTIFQTISLADRLEIEYTPARQTSIELDDPLVIPDNLVVRAARAVMPAIGAKGRVAIRLEKRIPMGAGLGGGSSDAAAVLLALPALAGRLLPLAKAFEIAQQLGSDVAFFLVGGTAAGIGRGAELFPLPDAQRQYGVLIAPGIHVSTAEAYAALSQSLTRESEKVFGFQSALWGGDRSRGNDFEPVVFERHPKLAALKKRLIRAGAATALMSGSGSSLYGLFSSREEAARAQPLFAAEQTFRFSLVNRARYRRMWREALERALGRV